jgi:hypothetical protein
MRVKAQGFGVTEDGVEGGGVFGGHCAEDEARGGEVRHRVQFARGYPARRLVLLG